MSHINPDTVSQWNGEFSCVLNLENVTVIISDKKRSIPLFYHQDSNLNWTIQDYIENHQIGQLDTVAINDFLLTGYVTGNKTLSPSWFQTEASTIIELSSRATTIAYSTFQTEVKEQNFDELVSELKLLLNQIFDDLKARLGDRKIILPLSGGYDSRIIALMLRDRNLSSQITTFTYGKPNNLEANVSQQIANRLNLDWHYYPYSKSMWKDMYVSDEWQDYVDYTFNLASAPHIQDFPSVKKIIEDLNIENGVFMPGHSLDFLAGSHLPYEAVFPEKLGSDDIIEFIKTKHYKLWETKNSLNMDLQSISKRIETTFEARDSYSSDYACSIIDDWNLRERQAKFIINSVRVYEFYNQQWTLPLWDDRLIAFFKKVPVKWKYKKYLYEFALHEMYPDFFPKPESNEQKVSLKNKYGPLYPVLKKVYRQQKLWKQYYNEPMEWFGIYPSYKKYLSNLSFSRNGLKFSKPYNINSFIVKDTVDNIRGFSK
ncbi:MAG: asparagine synthase C-terminal domain-containing protein [Melioribacteraceae bacterium]|nr:asparagine synthase C-terminal domain-containing protein [Melioribacteraceae bacterium]